MHGQFASDMEDKDKNNTWMYEKKLFERMHQAFDM